MKPWEPGYSIVLTVPAVGKALQECRAEIARLQALVEATPEYTLRDRFAAKAMQALFADPEVQWNPSSYEKGAASAYSLADAMLIERNKP